ncbi:MAG: trypsin-like serine protease [Desulfobacteraceae bacterium]|nr:trypsin-like serine protease [Desulfobacteraceae bacterium]
MASVFLGINQTGYNIANTGDVVYGQMADESVNILAGVTNIVLDQNIEQVSLAGDMTDFIYQQQGNQLLVFDSGDLVVTIPVQGDQDSTQLVFDGNEVYNAVFVDGVIELDTSPDDTVWVSEQTTYVGDDHDTFPYSAVVYIESTFSSGITYRGSGAVVGENDVLTASHAVYRVSDGGLADEIRVYPGRDGASIPLGPYYGGHVNYFEVDPDGDGTLSQQDSEDDLAIIGFDISFGNQTGWFGLDPDAPSGYYNATGYPGVYDDDTDPRMTNSYGLATKSDWYQLFDYETIETNPGNSGGPLWYEDDTSAYIAGVSSTSGWAVDIASHYNSILDWIAGNDFLLDQPVRVAITGDISESAEIALVGVSDFHASQALVDIA